MAALSEGPKRAGLHASKTSNTRLLRGASVVTLVGTMLAVVGFLMDPQRALESYLVAFAYVLSIPLGALFVLMIGYACNAKWISVLRRLCDGLALAIAPAPLLFLPIALGLERLYPWMRPTSAMTPEMAELVKHKASYLNAPSFVARSFGYFSLWILCAFLLRHWARRHVGAPVEYAEDALQRERAFSSAMLLPVSFAITFAAFDWLMSLEPTWFSTMFGVYYFAGSFLAGWAAISLCAYLGVRSGHMRDGITGNHFHALGRLLFAFVIFWAYAAYFQVFLIKIANRPIEVSFFIPRLEGAWKSVSYLLALGQFVLPFALLLPKSVKFRPAYVGAVSVFILVMHYVDVYWLVMPSLHPESLSPHWLDLVMLLAIGGLTVTFYAFLQRGVSPIPRHDPFFAEGIDYVSPT